MTSPRESWHISKIANKARKAIESLDLETQDKILVELEGLQTNPFLGNVKKVKGRRDIFRLRTGDFRVYFRVVLSSRAVEILLFDKRGAIKDKTLERL